MTDYNDTTLTRPTSIVSSASSRPSSTVSTNSISTSYSFSSNMSTLYPLPPSFSTPTTPGSPSFKFPTLETLNTTNNNNLTSSTNQQPQQQLPIPATGINPRHALMRSRRVSLPANLAYTNYQSLTGVIASSAGSSENRMSVASFSSFGSLPEEVEEELSTSTTSLSSTPSLKRTSTSPPESPTLIRTFQNFPLANSSTSMSRSLSNPRPSTGIHSTNSSLSVDSRSASPSGRNSPLSFETTEETKVRRDNRKFEKEQRKTLRDLNGSDLEKAKREERRWRIALELRDTERSYVKVLEEIDSNYYQPLLSSSVTIVPLSDLALRRARKAFSAPTSPNLSPTILPNRLSIYSTLESIPLLTNLPYSSQSTTSGPILSRQEIAEIFSNFKDVLGLSKVMLETLETEIKDKPSNSIPLSPLANGLERQGMRTPDLSSSAETEVEDGPRTPSDFKLEQVAISTTDKVQLNIEKKIKSIPSPSKLGKILLPILPFLKSYSLFVSNFSTAISIITSIEAGTGLAGEDKRVRWKRFCEEKERDIGKGKGKGLGLGGLLLNIVQRVPRYRFLLGDIIKYTERDHPDLKDLKRAFDIVDGVATHLESQIKNHASVLQILGLQKSFINLDAPLLAPGRTIIKSGTLKKLDRKGNEQVRTFFLFNDILIHASGGDSLNTGWSKVLSEAGPISAPMSRSNSSKSFNGNKVTGENISSTNNGSNQYKFHARLKLEHVTVVSIDDTMLVGRKFGFEILTPEKSFALYADSSASKSEWIEALRESKADLMRDRRTLQLDRRSPGSVNRQLQRDRRISMPASSINLAQAFLSSTSSSRSNHHSNSLPPPRLGFTPPSPSNDPLSKSPLTFITNVIDEPILFNPSFVLDSSTSNCKVEESNETPPDKIVIDSNVLDLAVEYPVAENYSAPVWVPDSKAERCMGCSGNFSVWRRRHHCRLCGAVVCWACSLNNFIIPSSQGEFGDDKLARSCDSCWDTIFGEGTISITRTLHNTTISSSYEQTSGEITASITPAILANSDEIVKRLGAVGRLNSLLGR